jgi:hypothetical protein
MEQAEPTSPWQPTSAPEMGRVLLEQQPDGAGGQQEADHPLPGVRAGEVPVVVQDSRHDAGAPLAGAVTTRPPAAFSSLAASA